MQKPKRSGHHEIVHENTFKQPDVKISSSAYLKSLKGTDVPVSFPAMPINRTGMEGVPPEALSEGYVFVARPPKPTLPPAGKTVIKPWSPKGRK